MNGEAGFGHPHTRSTVSRVGGVLLLAGGCLSLVLVALNAPGYDQGETTLLVWIAVVTMAVGGGCAVAPGLVPTAVLSSLPVLAAVLCCLPVYLAASPPPGTDLLLMWAVLFAAYFLPTRVAWLNVGVIVLGYAVILLRRQGAAALTPALCLASTSMVALVIVASLRTRLSS
jgi:hypothetical protein